MKDREQWNLDGSNQQNENERRNKRKISEVNSLDLVVSMIVCYCEMAASYSQVGKDFFICSGYLVISLKHKRKF